MSRAAMRNGSDRKMILGSVGFALGFYQVIDWTKFSQLEIEKELKAIIVGAELVSQLSVLFPPRSVLGLAIRVLLKFPAALLTVLVPIVVILAKQNTIRDVVDCPQRKPK
jgi:hypothetical protein